MNERLKQARIEAGFQSAAQAANRFGWKVPTYTGHENGSRGIKIETIEDYARAFRTDPVWLAFGVKTDKSTIANIPEEVLREVLLFVFANADFDNVPKDQIADTVIEICRYVHRSGRSGLENVVDFQMHRLSAGNA